MEETEVRKPMAQLEDFEWTDELRDYDLRLVRHDWYYHFSDDHGIWSAGDRAEKGLRRTAMASPEHLRVWEWHVNRINELQKTLRRPG